MSIPRMMSGAGRTGLLLILAVAMAGCAAPVKTEHDDTAAFDRYQTFAWQVPEREEMDDPELDSEMLDRRMADVLTTALVAAGYSQASESGPDFRVTYHVVERESRDSGGGFSVGVGGSSGNVGTGISFGSGGGGRELNLILDVMDANSGDLVWRGWSGTTRSVLNDADALRGLVDRILDAFPPEG